eukprot:207487-Hanusia_phi.AAC.1
MSTHADRGKAGAQEERQEAGGEAGQEEGQKIRDEVSGGAHGIEELEVESLHSIFNCIPWVIFASPPSPSLTHPQLLPPLPLPSLPSFSPSPCLVLLLPV